MVQALFVKRACFFGIAIIRLVEREIKMSY